jgi:hypothetical protein
MIQSDSRCRNVTAASARATTVMADCVVAINFRRSRRSARSPPQREKAMMGTTRVRPTNPRARGERVSR